MSHQRIEGSLSLLQPDGWSSPCGYSNGVSAAGRLIFVAGQVGWNEQQIFCSYDLVDQVRQALLNIVAVLGAGGARPEHLVRLNWYLADRAEYKARQKEIGVVYRQVIGMHYPAMTALQVGGFIEEGVCVEIEATAVVP